MSKLKSPVVIFLYTIVIGATLFTMYCVSHQCRAPTTEILILKATDYTQISDASTWETLASRVEEQPFNLISLIIFVLAIIHIFFTHEFHGLSEKLRQWNIKHGKDHPDSFGVEVLRFMGEVEVVFGLWVIPLIAAMSYYYSWTTAVSYLDTRDYTEPMFVIVIMILASTRPIIRFAEQCLQFVAQLGNKTVKAWWWSILTLGPLFGSLVTEPAAMTISAVLLGKQFYRYRPNLVFSYATLGLLFTNISVGGVLTNFAAPPVLMVKKRWMWDAEFMLENFGWKAIIGILLANIVYFFVFRREFLTMERQKTLLESEETEEDDPDKKQIPLWITFTHLTFLVWIVIHSHYTTIFLGSFLLFLGFYRATLPFQKQLMLKTSMMVGFFLAGLVVHGTLQAWWISPLFEGTSPLTLQILSTILTAFNDNAQITFLASLVPDFSPIMKYSVVAGAVTGGGLTVIANAPNLPGQSLLNRYFPGGISFTGLFLGAVTPTVIMGFTFYVLKIWNFIP